jgi:UDP-glucose 4-epimerase
MASAEDLGKYFRVPPDARDLNYEKFFERGEQRITLAAEYNSHNTEQLDVEGMATLLEQLPYMKKVLRGDAAVAE